MLVCGGLCLSRQHPIPHLDNKPPMSPRASALFSPTRSMLSLMSQTMTRGGCAGFQKDRSKALMMRKAMSPVPPATSKTTFGAGPGGLPSDADDDALDASAVLDATSRMDSDEWVGGVEMMSTRGASMSTGAAQQQLWCVFFRAHSRHRLRLRLGSFHFNARAYLFG